MTHKKKVLVVAAHPDDEILGCGGTMALHVDKGNDVYVVFMADGVASRGDSKNLLGKINERKQSAIEACAIIGCKHPVFLGFPDNQLDACSILDITQKLESVIDEINPEIVYTHHNKDLNVDHQLTHQAVITACRPQPDNTVSEIYSFETLSSTGWNSPTVENIFIPNVFVDITKMWKNKLLALSCYEGELREYPHARSYEGIEALSIYRGISVGIEYAEGFFLERKIDK